MKLKSLSLSLVAATLLAGLGAAPAIAQNTNTPGIERTQQEIRARIQQGIASGHITQQEAQELYQQERSIQFREMRFKADGNATPQEREQIRRELDAMRADVERKLANDRFSTRQNSTPGIDQREENIGARIDRGIASGQITRAEARRLHQRERDIQRLESRYKSDGKVTQAERKKLQRSLKALNEDVNRLLHNERRAIR